MERTRLSGLARWSVGWPRRPQRLTSGIPTRIPFTSEFLGPASLIENSRRNRGLLPERLIAPRLVQLSMRPARDARGVSITSFRLIASANKRTRPEAARSGGCGRLERRSAEEGNGSPGTLDETDASRCGRRWFTVVKDSAEGGGRVRGSTAISEGGGGPGRGAGDGRGGER